jgi:hypothetical protein
MRRAYFQSAQSAPAMPVERYSIGGIERPDVADILEAARPILQAGRLTLRTD